MNNVMQFTEDERYVSTGSNHLMTGKQLKGWLDLMFEKDKAAPTTVDFDTIKIRLRNGTEHFFRRTR